MSRLRGLCWWLVWSGSLRSVAVWSSVAGVHCVEEWEVAGLLVLLCVRCWLCLLFSYCVLCCRVCGVWLLCLPLLRSFCPRCCSSCCGVGLLSRGSPRQVWGCSLGHVPPRGLVCALGSSAVASGAGGGWWFLGCCCMPLPSLRPLLLTSSMLAVSWLGLAVVVERPSPGKRRVVVQGTSGLLLPESAPPLVLLRWSRLLLMWMLGVSWGGLLPPAVVGCCSPHPPRWG